MKKWLIAVLVLLVVAWWLYAPPYVPRFKAGGLDAPVVFEGKVSREMKCYIVDDLNLVYRHMQSHQVLKNSTTRKLEIEGRTIQPEWINFEGPGRYFPKAHFEHVVVIVWDGAQKLAIPRELIASYQAAWDLQQTHRAAFRAIDPFVDRLNRLANEPPRTVAELLVLDPNAHYGREELAKATPEKVAASFGGYKFRRPSVLEVTLLNNELPAFKGQLIGQLYYEKKQGIDQFFPPMLYHDGRWKLVLFDTE
jgi:hypothetical protein